VRLNARDEFSTKTPSRAEQFLKRSRRCQIKRHIRPFDYRFDFFCSSDYDDWIKRKRTGGLGQGQFWLRIDFFSVPSS
jgi:hypothetical protein